MHAPAPSAKRAGHPLLAAQAAAAERIPGLRALLDKAASRLAEPAGLLAGVEAVAALADIQAQALNDLLDGLPAGVVGGVFRLGGWNAALVVALDPALAFGLTDAGLGGDGVEEPSGAAPPPSRIDLALARMVLENAGVALRGALGGVRPVEMTLEAVELRFDRVECGQRRGRAVAARIEVAVFGRAAPLWVVLPVEVLNVLQCAAPVGANRAAPADPAWRNRFGGEVGQADVLVRAVITDRSLTLADVAGLKVGRTLRLQVSSDAPVLLESQSRRLFWGRLGQADGRYTVRIETAVGDRPDGADPGLSARARASALQMTANRKPSMSVSAIEPPDARAGIASDPDLGHVLGIPVTVDVLLGSTTMLVADLMKLGRGAILPLDGKVGDQVTIAVNGRAVARGEIVVLEDEDFRLGVSLTEVMGSASNPPGA